MKAIDTSAYEPNVNFGNVPKSELPAIGIHRATFSSYYADPYLDNYIDQWRALGMKTGAYMVLWSDAGVQAQVDFFWQHVGDLWRAGKLDLPPILDVEDSNLSFAQVEAAVKAIYARFGKYPMIYTAYYVWNDIRGSSDPSFVANNCKLWMAQYNTTPNLVPVGWSDWALWQYTETGKVTGINYNVDLSEVSPAYWQELTGDNRVIRETWFGGRVSYESGWSLASSGGYSFQYHVTRIPKIHVKELFVTPAPLHPRSTSHVARSNNVHVLSNGGEATYDTDPAKPKGQSISRGVAAPTHKSFVSAQFDVNGGFLGFLWGAHAKCHWAIGMSNWLLYDGSINGDLDNLRFRDPRSALFWNDIEWILIHIDGRSNGTLGITGEDLARFALNKGAKTGGNMDGGDSSTLVFNEDGNTTIKNTLPDTGVEHWLADHIGFILDYSGGNMGKYTCNVIHNTAERQSASIFGTKTGVVFLAGQVFQSDEMVTTTEYVSSLSREVTSQWVKTPSGNWTAVEFNGKTYVDVVTNQEPPPQDVTMTHKVEVFNNGSIKVYDAAGNLVYDG